MPKELEIIINPNPILRKKSEEISLDILSEPNFKEFLADMGETMIKKDGAGLAAPQVGKNIRVIAVNRNEKPILMINPRITKKSWAREIEEEGCLSVLNKKGEIVYAPVERCKKVNCTYFDEKGKIKKISAEKLLARVLQHEIDHLDGILFIDKMIGKKLNSIPNSKS
ncbi:MAG: peptide deformylase [Patescibacteria group bacterium]|jgi:peptide deformylase